MTFRHTCFALLQATTVRKSNPNPPFVRKEAEIHIHRTYPATINQPTSCNATNLHIQQANRQLKNIHQSTNLLILSICVLYVHQSLCWDVKCRFAYESADSAHALEAVHEFVYLGSTIMDNHSLETELLGRQLPHSPD